MTADAEERTRTLLGGAADDAKDEVIANLQRENEQLKLKLEDALASITNFHKQQKKLYEGFKVLRAK